MRFARILSLPDMLFFMKVVQKSDNIRLAQISCQILAVFFMSAGT